MLEALIQGILLGGYYAVLAAGLSLMFGVVRFINLAHGDMAVLGAMIALWLAQGLGVAVGWAIVITLPVMAGRNLAVLTEAATRMHLLRSKGVDPAAAFMARHSHFLERSQ